MDKLKRYFKINEELFIFLICLFIIALIAGSIYAVSLDKIDATLVKESLDVFFNNISNNKLSYFSTLKSSLFLNITFIISIWLLGISVIGIPIILFLFFSKGFVIGFALSSLVLNFKLKGIGLTFFYVFPHHIINIWISLFLIIYSIALSITIIKTICQKKSLNFKPIINKYFNILLITICLIIISSLLETFLSPLLLRLVFNL